MIIIMFYKVVFKITKTVAIEKTQKCHGTKTMQCKKGDKYQFISIRLKLIKYFHL